MVVIDALTVKAITVKAITIKAITIKALIIKALIIKALIIKALIIKAPMATIIATDTTQRKRVARTSSPFLPVYPNVKKPLHWS
ncbi:hypothetical protein TKWG_15160 [Advenella kashmirensis WT001]|uniref:Uncharacterized protein n=1 Tax=Advenella kashmirensis (strain DSM 17095 / LMG 22695 / WT001) TaxID=1036672 RepID=I3UDG6_ADVKW|nr:hypothetical protein [Advenella kashmirensis]AFK63054.1 hypothetical protein TKWG_15160 [Advenella kashmirensis WT001]